MLESFIAGCDIIITGGEDLAAGIRYDEANMFLPIILLLEKGISADSIKTAAASSGVPVLANDSLAGNLFKYGKTGNIVPELCCTEVSAILARSGKTYAKPAAVKAVKPPRPIRIEMGAALRDYIGGEQVFEEGLGETRKTLSALFGYRFPSIGISVSSKINESEYRILFRGLEAGRGRIDLGWYSTVDLGFSEIQLRAAVLYAASVLVAHLNELVEKRAPELLGRDEVQAILDAAEKKYPVVTGEVKSMFSLGSIRDILRGLVSEQVSIRHIPVILEILADWAGYGPAPNELIIEQIRQSLKRQICLDYTDDKQTLRVLTLETKLEKNFSDKVMFNEGGLNGALFADEWLEAFSPGIEGMVEKGLKPVVLCSPVSRSWIKEFTRMKFPSLAVLSFVEIPPDIKVEAVGEVALGRAGKKQAKGPEKNGSGKNGSGKNGSGKNGPGTGNPNKAKEKGLKTGDTQPNDR